MDENKNNDEMNEVNNINDINEVNGNVYNNETNENLGQNMKDSGVNTDEASNDELNEKQSQTLPIQLENTNYTEINDKKVKENKGGMRKRLVSYILVGAICSTLGGVGAGVVTMNMMNDKNTTTSETKATTTKSTSDVKANIITTNSSETLTIPEIVKKVSPAVVAISTNSTSANSVVRDPTAQQEGVGTGMIFSEEGYVLTNYHVISGAQTIKVTLSDGKEVSAKVINYDQEADVAVIKLAENTKVPGVVLFGDSDVLEVGESVVAIGNPLGTEFLGSVTTGVVSAVNRQVSIENKDLKFIQTDAAINPGNSGGPLVNSKGQVIGINTAKIGQTGVEGLGFAIPINSVNPKMDALIKPVLSIGIVCVDVTADMAKQYNLPVGVYVKQIKEFSSAEKSGITTGDIIVNFDGQKIKTVEQLNKIKGTHKAGDVVKLEVIRNNKTIKLDLTLSE